MTVLLCQYTETRYFGETKSSPDFRRHCAILVALCNFSGIVQFQLLIDTWYMVLVTCCMVLVAWSLLHVAWSLVLVTWSLVLVP